jgi:adenosine deaminase
MEDHVLPQLLSAGLCVTVNSDDPAYFGGYVLDNYRALFAAHPTLGPREAWQLAANSFEASFVDAAARDRGLAALAAVVESLASD